MRQGEPLAKRTKQNHIDMFIVGGCMTDWRLGNAQVINLDAGDGNTRLHSLIKSHRYGNRTRKQLTISKRIQIQKKREYF